MICEGCPYSEIFQHAKYLCGSGSPQPLSGDACLTDSDMHSLRQAVKRTEVVDTTQYQEHRLRLILKIRGYLSNGGMFNPELANHDAVRDLLLDVERFLYYEFSKE